MDACTPISQASRALGGAPKAWAESMEALTASNRYPTRNIDRCRAIGTSVIPTPSRRSTRLTGRRWLKLAPKWSALAGKRAAEGHQRGERPVAPAQLEWGGTRWNNGVASAYRPDAETRTRKACPKRSFRLDLCYCGLPPRFAYSSILRSDSLTGYRSRTAVLRQTATCADSRGFVLVTLDFRPVRLVIPLSREDAGIDCQSDMRCKDVRVFFRYRRKCPVAC
jgi:hypothetical protein